MRARPDVVLLVHEILSESHRGAARAITWADLRAKIADRLREPTIATRRAQEAAVALVVQGEPVVALSDRGVFLAETTNELDAGIRELDARGAGIGKRKSLLRAIRRRMVVSPQLELPAGGSR